jgi:phage I-like protein
MPKMADMAYLLASLVAQLTPGEKAVRLLPAGLFRSSDGSGRPVDAPAWRIDADTAAPIIARCAARQSRPVIDYEHQTLLAAQNGQPAPASGWMDSMEWREDGLYVSVDWTDKAAAMIAAGEYRYISPVFSYDKTGRVIDIKHAGLTNNPGLDGLTDLAALSSILNLKEKPEMDLKKLLAAIGLADDKTESDALTAIAALRAQADGAESRIATLTAQVAQAPDPAKWVPIEIHIQTQNALASLTATVEQAERETLMESGTASGQIMPGQEDYWSAQPVEALKAWLCVAKPIAALTGTQTGGKGPQTQTDTPSDASLAVMKAMGLTPEQYALGKLNKEV